MAAYLGQEILSSSATMDGIPKTKVREAIPSKIEGMPHFKMTQNHVFSSENL
jgi:hypothetical protein